MNLSRRAFVKLCAAAAGAAGFGVRRASRAVAQGGGVTLPRPDRPGRGTAARYAKDASYPPLQPLRPPAGAPNVVILLIDDMGFGASSAFGGPCHLPTLERIAAEGLKFSRFHTTALCSPTRQALLTGRNHHSVEMGAITEQATSVPGASWRMRAATASIGARQSGSREPWANSTVAWRGAGVVTANASAPAN